MEFQGRSLQDIRTAILVSGIFFLLLIVLFIVNQRTNFSDSLEQWIIEQFLQSDSAENARG
jgi:hypothetical protein